MRELERRIKALEKPLDHQCLCCELGQLLGPMPRCTHADRRSLAQELQELDREQYANA